MNAFHQTVTIQAQRLSPIASQQRRELTERESRTLITWCVGRNPSGRDKQWVLYPLIKGGGKGINRSFFFGGGISGLIFFRLVCFRECDLDHWIDGFFNCCEPHNAPNTLWECLLSTHWQPTPKKCVQKGIGTSGEPHTKHSSKWLQAFTGSTCRFSRFQMCRHWIQKSCCVARLAFLGTKNFWISPCYGTLL